jgi:GTP:adenosylcobinamide-phosphate guanylyltransferase
MDNFNKKDKKQIYYKNLNFLEDFNLNYLNDKNKNFTDFEENLPIIDIEEDLEFNKDIIFNNILNDSENTGIKITNIFNDKNNKKLNSMEVKYKLFKINNNNTYCSMRDKKYNNIKNFIKKIKYSLFLNYISLIKNKNLYNFLNLNKEKNINTIHVKSNLQFENNYLINKYSDLKFDFNLFKYKNNFKNNYIDFSKIKKNYNNFLKKIKNNTNNSKTNYLEFKDRDLEFSEFSEME